MYEIICLFGKERWQPFFHHLSLPPWLISHRWTLPTHKIGEILLQTHNIFMELFDFLGITAVMDDAGVSTEYGLICENVFVSLIPLTNRVSVWGTEQALHAWGCSWSCPEFLAQCVTYLTLLHRDHAEAQRAASEATQARTILLWLLGHPGFSSLWDALQCSKGHHIR